MWLFTYFSSLLDISCDPKKTNPLIVINQGVLIFNGVEDGT